MALVKSVIWDFNGTILDDVDLAAESISVVLRRRDLPPIGRDTHRQTFGFPVSEYYRRLGFDLEGEVHSDISDEFHEVYQAGVSGCSLNPGIREAFEDVRDAGIAQFVLSAAEEQMLVSWVEILGIQDFFEGVYGLRDRLAATKEQRCRDLIEDFGLDASATLFIGDTDHDVEVAKAVGCRPLVVLQGHQERKRFGRTDCETFDSFEELLRALRSGLEVD